LTLALVLGLLTGYSFVLLRRVFTLGIGCVEGLGLSLSLLKLLLIHALHVWVELTSLHLLKLLLVKVELLLLWGQLTQLLLGHRRHLCSASCRILRGLGGARLLGGLRSCLRLRGSGHSARRTLCRRVAHVDARRLDRLLRVSEAGSTRISWCALRALPYQRGCFVLGPGNVGGSRA